MARSLSLQLHSCQLQLTAVTQGTICLGMQHAPVRPVGHGRTLYPPVIVSTMCYHKLVKNDYYVMSCLNVAVDCGRLQTPSNDQLQVNFTTTTLGSTASYYCISGYTLSETVVRRCQANGTWSGTEPTCGELMCEWTTSYKNLIYKKIL